MQLSLTLFVLSVAALAMGPVMHRWVHARPALLSGLDAFVVLTVLGLVFGEVAPLALERSGFAALAAFLLGVSIPYVADRLVGHQRSHRWAQWVVAGGVLLHAAADGVALSTVGAHAGHALSLGAAVLLHRIPVGLGIWMLIPPAPTPTQTPGPDRRKRRQQKRAALALLAGVAVCTGLGQFLGPPVLAFAGVQSHIFSAFAAGLLLHVVVHNAPQPPGPRDARDRRALPTVVAMICAIALWTLLASIEVAGHDHQQHIVAGDLGWLLSVVPAVLLLGVQRGRPESMREGLVACACIVVTLWGGLWWGLALALVAGIGLHQVSHRSPSQSPDQVGWRSLRPDARAQRDLWVSGWIGAWIYAMPTLSAATLPPWRSSEGLLVVLTGLVLWALGPRPLLVVLPLISVTRVIPAWIAGALLGDLLVRGVRSPLHRGWRVAATLLFGFAGLALERMDPSWIDAAQPLRGTQRDIAAAIGAMALVWASVRVGIRSLLAGGGGHRHGKPDPHSSLSG